MKNWHVVSISMSKKKSTSSKNAITAASSGHLGDKPHKPFNSRIAQNFIIVWLNPHIEELNNNDWLDSIIELQRIINTVYNVRQESLRTKCLFIFRPLRSNLRR